MDATLIGRCATQPWEGFQRTLAACCETEGTLNLRNPAGRTFDVRVEDRVGNRVLTLVVLARPDRAQVLIRAGWVRAGHGQGPVSRNGWDTGAVAGLPYSRSWGQTPAQASVRIVSVLQQELDVTEPRSLRFEAESRVWADLLRVPAPGFGHRWHHSEVRVAGSSATGASGRAERGPTRCGRCGQALSDPASVRRGFGPECFEAMKGQRLIRRPV